MILYPKDCRFHFECFEVIPEKRYGTVVSCYFHGFYSFFHGALLSFQLSLWLPWWHLAHSVFPNY